MAELDRLPAFCVANKEGQPLQYEINGKPAAAAFADVDAAKAELAAARAEAAADDECDLIPVGLGQAFKLDDRQLGDAGAGQGRAEGGGRAARRRPARPAAALEGVHGDEPGGAERLRDPAALHVPRVRAAAVAQATEADNPDEALEIVGLSLDSVVERLSASDGEPAFTFVPPASSTAFIDAYLENSGGTAHSVGGGA